MDLQQVEKLVGEIQTGMKALGDTHEQLKKDTNALIEQKLGRIADDTSKAIEDLQKGQQKMQAALERPGAAGGDEKNELAEKERGAFTSYLRKGASRLTDDERKLLVVADDIDVANKKSLSTDSNPDGGYLVPVGRLGMISGRIFESSPLRQIADVRSTAFKSISIDLDDDEADGRWAGEGESGGETDTPQLGQIEITAHKMEAEPRATIEDLQDSEMDMEAWLAGKVSDKFSRMENTAFVSGSGPLKPRGFLTYQNVSTPGAYERDRIEQFINGSTSSVEIDALLEIQGGLKEPYQANAVWGMKRTTLTNIMKAKGSDMYRFLNLQPTIGTNGQAIVGVMSLLQKQVVLMDDMPAIATGALSIAYGDFRRGYQILDRVGISVLRDPFTSKGRVKFYTTKRTGGAVKNFEAIKLLKMAAS